MGDVTSRLNARMQARRDRSGVQTLTDDDVRHLDEYTKKLDDAIDLLREEIAAIGSGQLNRVTDIYPRKSELLKWLELRAPVVEPLLKHDVAIKRRFPERLTTFKELLNQDGQLLKQMAHVAASITREIEKLINRSSLDGLYGQSGEKLSALSSANKALDQEI